MPPILNRSLLQRSKAAGIDINQGFAIKKSADQDIQNDYMSGLFDTPLRPSAADKDWKTVSFHYSINDDRQKY